MQTIKKLSMVCMYLLISGLFIVHRRGKDIKHTNLHNTYSLLDYAKHTQTVDKICMPIYDLQYSRNSTARLTSDLRNEHLSLTDFCRRLEMFSISSIQLLVFCFSDTMLRSTPLSWSLSRWAARFTYNTTKYLPDRIDH